MRRLGRPLAGMAAVGLLLGLAAGAQSLFLATAIVALAAAALWGIAQAVARRRPIVADGWGIEQRTSYAPAPEHPPAPHGRIALALSRVEARELASSGAFGAGLGFCVIVIVLFGPVWGSDYEGEVGKVAELFPIFVHPLAGLVVLATHRALTRSTRDGTQELFDSCPAGWGVRTNGHLLTAWVPAVTALAFLAVLSGLMVRYATVVYGEAGGRQVAAAAGAVLLVVGATALGIALARWAPWMPAPVVAVVLIAVASIRLATAGDHTTVPTRQLSTWLNEPPVDVRFTAPHWAAHHLWVLALVALVTVLALARDHHGPWIGVAGVTCTAVAIVAAMAATQPIDAAEVTRIAALIDDAPAHQRCTPAAEVQVCAYRAADALADHLATAIEPVATASPPGALAGWTIRQSAGLDRAELDPAIVRRLDPTLPRDRVILLEMVGHPQADQGARFWVALTAVGITEDGADHSVVVVAGQARGVIALWLATRGVDDRTAAAMTSYVPRRDVGNADSLRPWPDPCLAGRVPVTWAVSDLEAARVLMAASEAEVAARLRADWSRLIDPATTTADLLDALGLAPVEPRSLHTRTGRVLSAAPSSARRGRARWRGPAGAWWPASRALPLATVGAILVLAPVPAAVTLLSGGDDLTGAVILATLACGAVAGFCVEDPAGDTIAASPTTLARRRGLRLATLALSAAATMALVVALAALAAPVDELRAADRLSELVTVAAVAAAVAAVCHRHGVTSAGAIGAVSGALAPLIVSSFAYRINALPTLNGAVHHGRWWLLAALGGAAAAWSARDPFRR